MYRSMLFIIALFFLTNLEGKNVGPDANGGTYVRTGNKITYSWRYKHENGKIYDLSFYIIFHRGWGNMQNIYERKDHTHGNYNRFITRDPFKQDLQALAKALRKIARNYNTSEILLALSFVQALPYQSGMGNYQRYAVETLIDAKGDCSDTSVLLAGIFAAWKYDSVFFYFNDHLAVGIWLHDIPNGAYYWHRNRKFFFCETTGTGWALGEYSLDNEEPCTRIENAWYG